MKTISSTQARQNFRDIINIAVKEPVSILKKNKPVATIISSDRYQELKKLEDTLYIKAAKLAIDEGLVSKQESKDLLDSIV